MNIQVQSPAWLVNYGPGFNAFVIRRRDFIAQGIQWFERWDALPAVPVPSHALIITGENQTVEAFGDGVKEGTVAAYLDDPNAALLVREPLFWNPAMGKKMVADAQAHIGERYNYALIGAMALGNSFVGHWLGPRFEQFIADWADTNRSQICSKLAAQVDANQPELWGRLGMEPCMVKPVDLLTNERLFKPGAIELVRKPGME